MKIKDYKDNDCDCDANIDCYNGSHPTISTCKKCLCFKCINGKCPPSIKNKQEATK